MKYMLICWGFKSYLLDSTSEYNSNFKLLIKFTAGNNSYNIVLFAEKETIFSFFENEQEKFGTTSHLLFSII